MQFAAADEQQLQWKAARAEFDVAAHALNDRLYPKEGHAAAAPRHPGSPLPPSWQDGDYLVARYGDLHGWQGHDYGVSGTQTATVDMLTMATEWDIIVAKDIGTQPVIEVTRFQTYDPFVGVILAEQVAGRQIKTWTVYPFFERALPGLLQNRPVAIGCAAEVAAYYGRIADEAGNTCGRVARTAAGEATIAGWLQTVAARALWRHELFAELHATGDWAAFCADPAIQYVIDGRANGHGEGLRRYALQALATAEESARPAAARPAVATDPGVAAGIAASMHQLAREPINRIFRAHKF